MIIFSGNTRTEYGMTPEGQFFEQHQVGKRHSFLRTTPDPERFLRWMVCAEFNAREAYERRVKMIGLLKVYWELCYGDLLRGTFNEDLYFKIIEAKQKNGTLYI